jgi:hypothetical protein
LGLKVTPDIKQRLDEAARERGWTQSQEAENRLRRSFEIEDAMGGFFTDNIVGNLGSAFRRGGLRAAYLQNLPAPEAPDSWVRDPFCYAAAEQLVIDALRSWRPGNTRNPNRSAEEQQEFDRAYALLSEQARIAANAIHPTEPLQPEDIARLKASLDDEPHPSIAKRKKGGAQ